MDDGVDAEALESAVAEGAAVAEGGARVALGEPRVVAEQLLEQRHAREVTLQSWHRRAADVQEAAALVVQIDARFGGRP